MKESKVLNRTFSVTFYEKGWGDMENVDLDNVFKEYGLDVEQVEPYVYKVFMILMNTILKVNIP